MRLSRVVRKGLGPVMRLLRGPLPVLSETEQRRLRTVCIFLGPYRNLTTLTASMLALHPGCQVLNHAGERVLEDGRLDFLKDYTHRRVHTFCRFAIDASQGGERGDRGGSITLSHAFDQPKMREVYERRFGDRLLCDRVEALVWKESLRVANHLRRHGVEPSTLSEKNPKIRFLMPVRNPMDCAVSNRNTGHARHFEGLGPEAAIEEIVEAFLDEYAWFSRLENRAPESFFSFHQDEVNEDTLVRMAEFLRLEPLSTWIGDVLEVYAVESRYDHAPDLVRRYEDLVFEKFDRDPDLRDRLLRFARV